MQALAEKYRPCKIADFLGLDKPKQILTRFAAHPHPTAWLFIGPPGVGKTSMALALAEEMDSGADLIKIPSAKCNIEKVREIEDLCRFAPIFKNAKWYLFLVDEADEMSYQ